MGFVPDEGIATMTKLLVQATRQIDEAIGYLGSDDDRATAAADAASRRRASWEPATTARSPGCSSSGTPASASRAASSTASASESAKS